MRTVAIGSPQSRQTAPMVLVQTPQGYGWVPYSAANGMGQTPGAAPSSMGKNLVVIGILGLAGYWAWKKWGGGESMSSMDDFVSRRRRRRSKSRLMSEFEHFLDARNHSREDTAESSFDEDVSESAEDCDADEDSEEDND